MNIKTYPILKSERLILRRLLITDYQSIFELRSDTDVNRFLDRQLCKSTEDAKYFINNINENIEKGVTFYWAICLTDSNELVGTIGLFDFSSEHDSCEIGFEILLNFQRKGIMREAMQTVLDYAFTNLKITVIKAITHSENQASINLLHQLNFERAVPNVPIPQILEQYNFSR